MLISAIDQQTWLQRCPADYFDIDHKICTIACNWRRLLFSSPNLLQFGTVFATTTKIRENYGYGCREGYGCKLKKFRILLASTCLSLLLQFKANSKWWGRSMLFNLKWTNKYHSHFQGQWRCISNSTYNCNSDYPAPQLTL